MAWSWSHTQEAYDYAHSRLAQLTDDQLVEVYAEWFAYVPGAPAADHDGCVAQRLPIGVIRASSFERSRLEEVIWNYASMTSRSPAPTVTRLDQGEGDVAEHEGGKNEKEALLHMAADALVRPTHLAIQEGAMAAMSEQATCDNGGWNAWVCPYGCHTVPFSPEEEDAKKGE